MTTNIPISIDYTSRDYYSLREELLNRVRIAVNADTASNRRWTGDDPSDFGVALIEAFAYMGDVLNYYVDRIANESYLPTASQRQNVINLAESYGYRPAGFRAAYLSLRFSNTSDTAYTLPTGTQISGQVISDDTVEEVIFTTLEAVIVPAAVGEVAGTATVGATHTESVATRPENLADDSDDNDIAGEFLGMSNGSANQTFALAEDRVVDGSVQVWVQNGDVYEPWQQVVHLSDFGPSDAVFTVKIDADNITYVIFGDGVSGTVPAPLTPIKVVYDVGGGEVGNCSIGVLDTIYRVPGLNDNESSDLNDFLLVTNESVGVGGASPESTASIRANAPKLLRAITRAVSLQDYENITLAIPNVGKANAEAATPTSVNLFIAPQRNEGSNDSFPGYDATGGALTTEWASLQADVQDYLVDKTQLGVSITFNPPTYIPVAVVIKYTKFPQYTTAQVESAIKLRLLTRFSYTNLDFGQLLTPEDVEFELMQVDGVRNVQVTELSRTVGDDYGVNALIGAPNEIFVFQESGLTVSAASNVATLSGLSVPAGTTLSPTFASEFFTYNLLNVTTDNIILTPTAANSTATVTINGNPSSTPIDTPAGQVTTVPVVVTAGDNSTFRVYTVVVSRA
jgi:hypothetical protein